MQFTRMIRGTYSLPLQVTAVPTVVGVRGGRVTDRFVGAQEMQFIKEFLHRLDS